MSWLYSLPPPNLESIQHYLCLKRQNWLSVLSCLSYSQHLQGTVQQVTVCLLFFAAFLRESRAICVQERMLWGCASSPTPLAQVSAAFQG